MSLSLQDLIAISNKDGDTLGQNFVFSLVEYLLIQTYLLFIKIMYRIDQQKYLGSAESNRKLHPEPQLENVLAG